MMQILLTLFSDDCQVLDNLNLALAFWRLQILFFVLINVMSLVGLVARPFWYAIVVL